MWLYYVHLNRWCACVILYFFGGLFTHARSKGMCGKRMEKPSAAVAVHPVHATAEWDGLMRPWRRKNVVLQIKMQWGPTEEKKKNYGKNKPQKKWLV